MNVIGYVRVSRREQARSGLGLAAQRDAIRGECDRRGWLLLRYEEDVRSGSSDRNREGLRRALAECRARTADGLVVAKLDRLSRSVVDAGKLIEEAQCRGWNLVALDMGIDLSTPNGRLVAHVLAAVGQWERERIGERIREALAAKRVRDDWTPGRPRQIPAASRALIVTLAASGQSAGQIARLLNERGVEAIGGRWHRTTIDRVLLQERK
jgi:DNA invertase Pin-like site-specific DNA recombinase